MSQPIEAFRNAFKIPELKQRILFSLVILAVYRLGAHVPTPGIDGAELAKQMSGAGGLMGFYDMFSGGAFGKATVFALGIMPYISASIIISLLTTVIPALEKLSKEGAEGQKKITEYTRYGTIGLCIIQSIGISLMLQNMNNAGSRIVANPGLGFTLMCVITFTTGTAFIMWLGEQISERGIGNGISLIIFTSIISGMPNAIIRLLNRISADQLDVIDGLILMVLMGAVIAGAILVTTGQRRVPVQYPRQIRGRKVYGGQRNYLPLRVNQAGVIPIIFAGAIMTMPAMMAQAIDVGWVRNITAMLTTGMLYGVIYATLIIFFSFFYTAITFNPVQMADDLKKYGGVIMGVRPGKATAEYLNKVMTRVTVVGALFLAGVALMPTVINAVLKINDLSITSFFGGTGLLILVGVALDTVKQIEQHLVMHHYDGFMKGRRLRGRRR